MKIEERIKQHLTSHHKVVVPNLGTFTALPASARMKEEGGILHPPTLQIAFSNDIYDVADESIAKWLLKYGDVSEDELKYELESFTKGIKNNVDLHGKGELKGLGYFIKDSQGNLAFKQDDEVVLGADSFGLPKLEAKPLTPAVITDKIPVPSENNKLLMAAIAIPLIVLFFLFLFFLLNRDSYEKLTSYFSGDTPALVEERSNTDEVAENSFAKIDSLKAAREASEEKDSEAGDKASAKTAEKSKTVEPKPQPKEEKPVADAGSSTDLVVSSKTNRYYVIIGSYSDIASAKKAALKCRKIGYETAKVVNIGNRVRVSLQDFAQKPEASTFATKAGKDYAGAWVFAN